MRTIKEDDLIPEIFSEKKPRDTGLILASPHPILADIVHMSRICVNWYYKNKKDLPLKLKPRVWSKPLTLVDGEKMMGWVAANYLFCVPTIAAATAEVPTPLKGA